jgi:diguanylate cyclase (GGDEF)-like protein
VALRADRPQDGGEESFEVEIARDDRGRSLKPDEIAYSRSIVRRTLAEKKPLVLDDQPGFSQVSESATELGLRAAMCVPLRVFLPHTPGTPVGERRRLTPRDPDVLGVLYVDSAAKATRFDLEDLEFLSALANQATATILNARLYQLATTDPLSGLYTRWQFQRVLADAAERAEEERLPYSLLLIDIDDFKAVNDQHGHLAGDEVIREMGDLLRAATRAEDSPFRYGGEEFAVILANTDEGGALFAAEKVRAAVAARRFAEPMLKITASIGAATAPAAAHDPTDTVKRADQALYAAKLAGKNRVERWTESAVGAAAKRSDKLAGIVTGDFASDYRNVAVLIDAIASIGAAGEVSELLERAVDKVVEATGAERGALMLADEDAAPASGKRPRLQTVVARDRRKRNLRLVERFSRSIPEQVLASGAPICLTDAQEPDRPGSAATESVTELALRTVLCVPLATKERTLGVIYVDSRARRDLSEATLPFLEGLARQVAFAIENARLKARLAYEEGARLDAAARRDGEDRIA